MKEDVLCIPESHWLSCGGVPGFHPCPEAILQAILDPALLRFIPRHEAEQNPKFKQLIPYVLFRSATQWFGYQRTSAGGERRLALKWSLGFGGHVNQSDGPVENAFAAGLKRELAEEIATREVFVPRLMGTVYDPKDAVGAVHVGVVFGVLLAEPDLTLCDTTARHGRWQHTEAWLGLAGDLESWSSLTLQALGNINTPAIPIP
jgi:predicted NUDIX family phosphoesterase